MAASRTYLDHNATAPLRPEARAAMLAALDRTGNAASVHEEGRRARETVEQARDEVAALLGARPEEIVFTSGATEANNWVMRAGWSRIVIGATEHESVLAPAREACASLTELPSAADGRIETAAIPTPLSTDGRGSLVSLHFANSETGVVQPVAAAVETAHAQGAVFHTDAVQAAGRVPLDFAGLGVDLMSISAHKLGGPQGIGALVIRDGIELPAFITGGGQQRRRRSGTENVAAAAGFGAAARAARESLPDMARIEALRDEIEAGVRAISPEAVILGARAPERLANTTCIALPGCDAATLLIRLDLAGLAVSVGSACSSGRIGGSHVLRAMGIDEMTARAAIRISLGPTNTGADVSRFLDAWAQIQRTAQSRKPLFNSTTSHAAAASRSRAPGLIAGE